MKAYGSKIQVGVVKVDSETLSGIIIKETVKQVVRLKVLSVGGQVDDIQVGDHVFVDKANLIPVKYEDNLLFVDYSNILAVIPS